MVFEWDPKKAAGNLKKHGVDFHEGATVLDDDLSTTFPDLESSAERRYITIGMSSRRRLLVVVHTEEGPSMRVISARRGTRREQRFMKKTEKQPDGEMRAEYDFKSMKGGVRGKYVKQYGAGTNLVLLDPLLAEAFPTDAAVNEALLAVLNMMKIVHLPAEGPRTTARKGRGAG